jgi:RNA polymerase-interacting CarD/CdnL/TRCF family regulator
MKWVKPNGARISKSSLIFKVGDKIIFASQGPCLIDAVVHKVVGDTMMIFYRLARLDDTGGKLFVPVDKIRKFPIRPLLQRSEIPELLSRLGQKGKPIIFPTTPQNWKQRSLDCSRLLASGRATDLADVVESLTDLNETRALGSRDRENLARAKRLLACEIAEVSGDTRLAVTERIDIALDVRRSKKSQRTRN